MKDRFIYMPPRLIEYESWNYVKGDNGNLSGVDPGDPEEPPDE